MAVQRARRGFGFSQQEVPVLAGSVADMRETLEHAASQASFEAWIAEVETQAQSILKGADTAESMVEDSPVHFATRILRHLQLARGAIKRKNASQAAYYAALLGHLVCLADLKFEWESVAIGGAGSRRGSKNGGNTTGQIRSGSVLARDRLIFRDADTELAVRKAGKKEGASLKAVLTNMIGKKKYDVWRDIGDEKKLDTIGTYNGMLLAYNRAKKRR